jgi:hypothetical protein
VLSQVLLEDNRKMTLELAYVPFEEPLSNRTSIESVVLAVIGFITSACAVRRKKYQQWKI